MVPSDMDLDPQLSTQAQETRPVAGVAAGQGTTLVQKELASTACTAATPTYPPRPLQPAARLEPQNKEPAATSTSTTTTTTAAAPATSLCEPSMSKDQEHLAKIDVTMNLPAGAAVSSPSPTTTANNTTLPSSSSSSSTSTTGQSNSAAHRPSLASEAALAAVKAVRENPSTVLSNGSDSHPRSRDKDIEMEGDETEDEIHTSARRPSVNGHHHDEDADAEGEDEDGYDAAPISSGGGGGDNGDGGEGNAAAAQAPPAQSQAPSHPAKRKQGRQRKPVSALTSPSSSTQHIHSSGRQQTTPPPSIASPPLVKDDSPVDGQNVTEEKYRRLKRKLKEVLQENERMAAELERSHRRVRNLRKEKNLLLDKIIRYERGQESDSVSELSTSLSSDSESSDASLYSRKSERPWSSRHANGGRRDGSLASARQSAAAAGSAGSGPRKSTNKTPRRRSPSTSGGVVPLTGSAATAAGATASGEGEGADGQHQMSPSGSRAAGGNNAALKNKDQKPLPVPSLITNVGSAFQKPKRIHTSAKQRATNMMKVKKVLPLARDEQGNVKLPCTIGILTVMSLGKVIWDREAFHNERYIWPVGYKMSRLYNSMIDKNSQTTYTCSVIDDGDAPKFMIEVGDQPGKPIIAGTATGAWTHVVKAANEIRKRDHSNSASGPDYFGFSNPTIAKLIQELPDADKCEHYIMQRFEEGTGRSGSAAQAAAGEKRRLGRAGGGGSGGGASSSSAAGGDKSKDGSEGGKDGEHESSKEEELDEEEDSDYVSLGTSGIKPPPTKKLKVGGESSDDHHHGDDGGSGGAMAIDSGDGSAVEKKHGSGSATMMDEDIDIEANDEEEEEHDEHEEEEVDELEDDDGGDDDDEDDVMASAAHPPASSSSSSNTTGPSTTSSSSSFDVQPGAAPSSHHHQAATSGSSTGLGSSLKHSAHDNTASAIVQQQDTAISPAQEPVHSIAASTSSAAGNSGPSVIVTSE